MHNKNIVAIGGGGFGRSLGSLEIEKYIVSLTCKKRPKVCFIPTASGDNSLYKLNFYRAFSKLNCVTSHIDFFSRTVYPLSIFWLQIRIKKSTNFMPIDSKMTTSQLWFNLLPVLASLLTVIFSLTNAYLYIFGKLINY